MLSVLDDVLKSLPAMLDDPDAWDSLIVNRRKPITYRVFRYLADDTRVSLHKFDPCARHEAYPHPHPWPGAFTVSKARTACGSASRPTWNRANRSP